MLINFTIRSIIKFKTGNVSKSIILTVYGCIDYSFIFELCYVVLPCIFRSLGHVWIVNIEYGQFLVQIKQLFFSFK